MVLSWLISHYFWFRNYHECYLPHSHCLWEDIAAFYLQVCLIMSQLFLKHAYASQSYPKGSLSLKFELLSLLLQAASLYLEGSLVFDLHYGRQRPKSWPASTCQSCCLHCVSISCASLTNLQIHKISSSLNMDK